MKSVLLALLCLLEAAVLHAQDGTISEPAWFDSTGPRRDGWRSRR